MMIYDLIIRKVPINLKNGMKNENKNYLEPKLKPKPNDLKTRAKN